MKTSLRYYCDSCGADISEEELIEKQGICPICGKREGWISGPFTLEDLDEEG